MLPLTPLDSLLTGDPAGSGAAAEGRGERRTAIRSLGLGVVGTAAVIAVAAIGALLAIRELVGSFLEY